MSIGWIITAVIVISLVVALSPVVWCAKSILRAMDDEESEE